MNKKKIILLVPNLSGHGQERQAALAANVLCDSFDVTLVVFTDKGAKYTVNSELVSLGLPAVKGWFRVIRVIQRVFKVRKLRIKEHANAVISFGPSANIVNVLSRGVGKSIISYRGHASLKPCLQLSYSCKYADRIFCISEGMRQELVSLYPESKGKQYVLYNGIDIDGILAGLREEIDFEPNNPAFVNVGRLEPVKGQYHIINAFKMVLEQIPTASLTFVGDGSLMPELTQKVHALCLDEKVHFVGAKSNPFPWIAKCDICVMTSITEGFLNVISEAGVCGVPTISTDCPSGPREQLSENMDERDLQCMELADYGILVPNFSSSDMVEPERERILADAMIFLAKDEALYERYKELISKRVHKFSVETYRQNLIDIIKDDD